MDEKTITLENLFELLDSLAEPKKEKTFREVACEFGKHLYEGYLGFMDAGFNEHQAFEILMRTHDDNK